MKKWIAAAAALCVLLLTGCGGAKLPDGFEQEKVLAAAESTLEKINALAYDAVTDELREDLRGQLTAGQLEEAWGARLDELGAFEEIRNTSFQGTAGQDGEEFAVVILQCAYENGTAIYTLSYDADYALVGLYMK